MKQNISQDL